ncbi:GLUCAN ENDO-13-BETA-GLUCOSIDASE BG1-RELATED-RELATED [Salix purpurea]|uniref:GLUCAN ENDO-13-BETA-GLUCOSIDASE BG1-RELATED-RELATED n=1 Tax=Salix purpurea TaxID=77065 RepID=A0A9Q0PQX5_SALPP|nr:GLUCAN ENDO-13-BETA-GLUCOSIDASE BG1-RELATED-RELATED [Salix purpurea]
MVHPFPLIRTRFLLTRATRRPETLAFCLFQPNSGRVDSGNGIKYMNMFDAQVRTFKLLLITLISFLTCWCGEWSCVPYT